MQVSPVIATPVEEEGITPTVSRKCKLVVSYFQDLIERKNPQSPYLSMLIPFLEFSYEEPVHFGRLLVVFHNMLEGCNFDKEDWSKYSEDEKKRFELVRTALYVYFHQLMELEKAKKRRNSFWFRMLVWLGCLSNRVFILNENDIFAPVESLQIARQTDHTDTI